MTTLGSLIQQPQSVQPPDQQGSSGTSDQSSLQSIMQSKPPQGGAPGSAPGQPPAPNHAQTVAAIQHISAFDKRWKELLDDPEAGTKNMRSQIYDVMADMMGDGYVTLPQVMNELKALPTDPLEQKQWLEKHYQTGQQAMSTILQQHAAAAGPPQPGEPPPQIGPSGLANNHTAMMSQLASHYRARTPKKPISAPNPSPGGIPMRMQ